MPLWETIIQAEPDLWIWTGDIVYADTTDMTALRNKYNRLKNYPMYQEFLEAMPVIGVWDDHDYGLNDGGKEYSMKAESQQVLLDFLDEPKDTIRRNQEGVYTSYTFGPPEKMVKIILLDTRYHREKPGFTATILGEEQWEWFENELNSSTAKINIIVSSIQVTVYQSFIGEQWHNFPQEKRRLFKLIKKSKAKGVILVCGDKHFGTIERARGTRPPIYDITSSGMTHVIDGNAKILANLYYRGKLFADLNFGMIIINWEVNPPQVKLQIRDQENKVRMKQIQKAI